MAKILEYQKFHGDDEKPENIDFEIMDWIMAHRVYRKTDCGFVLRTPNNIKS
jgi:hypothetical protein